MEKMKQTTLRKKYPRNYKHEYAIRNKIPRKLTLSPERAEEIMVELREGTSYVDIAKDFGVSRVLVRKINLGDAYRIDAFSYPVHDRTVTKVKENESLV